METAIESAVGFLLENLVQLIQENHELISGAGSKVTELSKNLELLKSFVTRHTENHFQNDTLRELAKQIRALIQEAEDAIEEYVYCVSLHKARGAFDRALNLVDYKLNVRAVIKKIEDISERVDDTHHKNYLIGEGATRSDQSAHGGSVAQRPKGGGPGADKVIGFQDAATAVIERLTGKKMDQQTTHTGKNMNQQTAHEPEQHKTELKQKTEVEKKTKLKQNTEFEELEVVSIIGMLGLGKTTLARKVLSDPVIEYELFTSIFVVVSEDYDKREVLQIILVQGGFFKNITELNGKSIQQLGELISEKLKNKYLVVLDDVWDNVVWDDLQHLLPDNKKGSW